MLNAYGSKNIALIQVFIVLTASCLVGWHLQTGSNGSVWDNCRMPSAKGGSFIELCVHLTVCCNFNEWSLPGAARHGHSSVSKVPPFCSIIIIKWVSQSLFSYAIGHSWSPFLSKHRLLCFSSPTSKPWWKQNFIGLICVWFCRLCVFIGYYWVFFSRIVGFGTKPIGFPALPRASPKENFTVRMQCSVQTESLAKNWPKYSRPEPPNSLSR